MTKRLAPQILGIAGIYFLSGLLGMQFSLPPGYASPVFPPAGVALAWVLYFGARTLPGVLVGSAAMNVYVASRGSVSIDATILLSSLVLGCSAALQTFCGMRLMRWSMSFPRPFREPRSVLFFVLVVAPGSSLINASLGPLNLLISGILPPEAFWGNALSWWIGDTIGVLLFTPITLAFFPSALGIAGGTSLAITGSLLALFGIFAWSFSAAQALVAREQLTRFEALADSAMVRLRMTVDTSLIPLHALRGLVGASSWVEADRFQSFALPYLEEFPAIHALSWNPLISHEQRVAFEAAVRTLDEDPGFYIRSIPGREHHIEAEPAPDYIVIRLIEPRSTQGMVIGYDVGSNPKRRRTLEAARKTGNTMLTEPITLIQEKGEQSGALATMPVYAPSDAGGDSTCLGFVVAVLRWGDALSPVLEQLRTKGIAARVLDQAPSGAPVLLTADPDWSDDSRLTTHRSVLEFSRHLRVDFEATDEFFAQNRSPIPTLVLMGGLLFTGLLAAFLLQLASTVSHVNEVVDERTADLLTATRRAENANRLKQTFLSNVSHEIRTPLNAVVGATEILADRIEGAEEQRYLRLVRKASDELLRLIADLLDISRIERDELSLSIEPFELHREMEELRELMQLVTQEHGVRLDFDVSPAGEMWWRGDVGRIRQILVNLITNAAKFSDGGSVVVRVAVEDEESSELVCSVEDTGSGIVPELQEKIFEPFVRDLTKSGGTGLGLAISRRLAEMMGGTIDLESQVGQGSTFTLRLPLQRAPRPDNPPGTVTPRPGLGERGVRRILLVEDDEVNRLIAKKQLQATFRDAEIREAENGTAALDVIQSFQPDMVLMDCHMPQMDGFAAAAAIRSLDAPVARIPIIALTASAMIEDQQRCLAAGMDAFLAKPFKRRELEDVIQRLFSDS